MSRDAIFHHWPSDPEFSPSLDHYQSSTETECNQIQSAEQRLYQNIIIITSVIIIIIATSRKL